MPAQEFEAFLKETKPSFHPVVPFGPEDKLLLLDFTANNTSLTTEILANTERFSEYVEHQLKEAGALYGIGGYNEHRTIYQRSVVFDVSYSSAPDVKKNHLKDDDVEINQLSGAQEQVDFNALEAQEAEPRRLHLGVDIWGAVDTPVYAPLEGTIHSIGYNDAFGDYGATLVLQHEINGFLFHTLYGHLSLKSITGKQEGQDIEKGSWIASFGDLAENGNWPPHLHFQVILDMQGWKGDYPGVCKFSEREQYLSNCPDPDLLLQMIQHK